MRKLVMTRGLPGSGKTTWAIEEKARLEAHNLKCEIVCKDDIRANLEKTGWKWSKEGETEVKRIQTDLIRGLFSDGLQINVVIVADTNFGGHKQRLQQLAKECGAEFEIKDFTHVDVQECVRRDAGRGKNSVGVEVIKRMYAQYLAMPEVEPYVPPLNANIPDAFICDIDGTVAIMHKRGPYDYAKVGQDKLNTPVASVVHALVASGLGVIYCSGRDDSCRGATLGWLTSNGLPAGPLFMRRTGDHRKDFIVKQELFDQHIRYNFDVKLVLDDRSQVVKMWRRLGLTCLQVAEGEF